MISMLCAKIRRHKPDHEVKALLTYSASFCFYERLITVYVSTFFVIVMILRRTYVTELISKVANLVLNPAIIDALCHEMAFTTSSDP
jgi:hypothetical protein